MENDSGETSLLDKIRSLGPYEIRYSVLLFLLMALGGIQNTLNIFLQMTPWFYCSGPIDDNATITPAINFTTPPGDLVFAEEIETTCAHHEKQFENCTNVIFNYTVYGRTAVTEWDLVCSQGIYSPLAQCLYMLGYVAGCAIFTAISDRFGRKMSLYISLMFVVICGVCSGTSQYYWGHVISRMCTGAGVAGVMLVAFVMVIEMLGTQRRLGIIICMCIVFSCGVVIQDGVAYITKDFVETNIVSSAIPFFTLFYWWIIPESPQWLVSRGRFSEAQRELDRAAKINNFHAYVDIVDLIEEAVKCDGVIDTDVRFWSVLRAPNMRKKTLVLMTVSFAVYLASYGLFYFVALMARDSHFLLFFMCVADLIAYCTIVVVLDKTGRRFGLLLCMAVATMGIAISSGLYNHFHMMCMLMALLGKLGCGGATVILYLFGVEIFPSVVQTQGFAAQAMFAHMGASLSPIIIYVAFPVWRHLPLLIFAVSCAVAGSLSGLLPETHQEIYLPKTLLDGELQGKKQNMEYVPTVHTPLVSLRK